MANPTARSSQTVPPRQGIFIAMRRNCKGQALLESALMMVLFAFICFGMMQVILKINAEQVHQWGLYGGSRARVVGYGDPGVQKMFLVGNILNSGEMYAPSYGWPAVTQSSYEMEYIPRYLGPGPVYNNERLDYRYWPNLPTMTPAGVGDIYTATSEQEYPLEIARMIPLLETSFGTDTATLQSDLNMDNHYPLYLNSF
jgi:hypothetical protein